MLCSQSSWEGEQIIVDYALSIALSIEPDLHDEQKDHLSDNIRKYLRAAITSEQCAEVFLNIITFTKPVDEVSLIITCCFQRLNDFKNTNFQMANISFNHSKRTRNWNCLEDRRLLAGILLYGENNWELTSQIVDNGRSKSHGSQRWQRCVDRRIKKDDWTNEEDKYLLDQVQIFGESSWSKISRVMGD